MMWKTLLAVSAMALLAGCSSSSNGPKHDQSSAAKPLGGTQAVVVNAPLKPLNDVKRCLQGRGSVKGKFFALGPWFDNTGKENGVANGATGRFLPGLATTLSISQPLIQIGGRPIDLVNIDTEKRLRDMMPIDVQNYLAKLAADSGADYLIDGGWMTLDLGKMGSIDAQGDGIGPFGNQTEATVVAYVNIKRAGSGEILATSILRRSVFSTTAGVSFGRYFGGVVGTGEIGFTKQQRLQIESVDYLAITAWLEATTMLTKSCGSEIQNIVAPPLSTAKKQVASL